MKLLRPIHHDLPNFNLVPWRERQRRTRWRRIMQFFAALGALLSVGLLALLAQQLVTHADLQALLSEVEQQQQPDLGAHNNALQHAHALYQQQRALDQLRLQLAELTSTMPTDAMLTEVVLDANTLTLIGTAQHIQTITALQKILQRKTQTRVVLEHVEVVETSAAHLFRIRIPIDADVNHEEGAS